MARNWCTIPTGETRSFTRDYDDLQALMIDDADLLIFGAARPDDNTSVQRDGNDFGYRDTIVFAFTHSKLIIDFEMLTTTQ